MNTKTLFDLAIINELYIGYFMDEYLNIWSSKQNIPRRLTKQRAGWILYYNGKMNYHNSRAFTSMVQNHEAYKAWMKTSHTLNSNGDITPSNGFIVTPLSGVVDLTTVTVYNTEIEARKICEELAELNKDETYTYLEIKGKCKVKKAEWIG